MPDTIEDLLDDDKAFEGFARAQVSMVLTNPHLEDNPIVYVNQAFTRVTGYARTACIGRNCRFLQGENTSKSDVDKLRIGIEAQQPVTVDLLNFRANGEPFENRLIVAPITGDDGNVMYFIGIQKELRENDSSTRIDEINEQLIEIQNRVCSDLSMIIGMIRQQSHATSVPEDFKALSRRIETMQLLYEEMKLSDSQSNRDSIQMGSFVSRRCAAIAHIEGRSGIRLSLQIEALEVPIETATRVGLVVSELITNCYLHAFERMDMGLVEVRMSRLSEGGLRLIVTDDGNGIPTGAEWPDQTTVGGRIITGLIEGLEGTLQLNRGAAGSVVSIDVPASATTLD